MPTIHTAYTQTATLILSTEMNSLAANGITVASAAIDNRTNLDLFMDLELFLNTQSASRQNGATVPVYMIQALDETNYADVLVASTPPIAVFNLAAATTAARPDPARDISIPPGLFKLFLTNGTNQVFNASGNTLKYRTRSVKSV